MPASQAEPGLACENGFESLPPSSNSLPPQLQSRLQAQRQLHAAPKGIKNHDWAAAQDCARSNLICGTDSFHQHNALDGRSALLYTELPCRLGADSTNCASQ